MAISMLKIRRPLGRLIFNMGIAIPGKTVFLIETAPRRSTIRWFLWYERVRFLRTITRNVILMICQWKLAKMQDWKLVWKPLNSQSIVHGIAILFIGEWNDITRIQVKMIQTLFHAGYSRQITLASKRTIARQRRKRYGVQKVQRIKHIKQI